MSVFIYEGGFRLVRKSGVGQAMLHQREALRKAGIIARGRSDDGTKIMHLNTVFPDSLLMLLIARIRGWKVICFAHSTMEDFKASFPLSSRLAPLFRRYITFCYDRADVVITPSEYSRNLILGYGVRRPVHAVSNGVDTARFRRSAEKADAFRRRYRFSVNDKVVITAALPIERKGILDFIEIARTMADVQFMWFGSLSSRLIPKRIRRAMEDAPSNVRFAGFISQEELIEAYSGADGFLFMSHEETEGIAVLEALSCGIPAVLRDIPVYSDLRERETGIHLFRSMDECRSCLREILDGGSDDAACLEREVAEERDLGMVGRKLRAIYRDELLIDE